MARKLDHHAQRRHPEKREILRSELPTRLASTGETTKREILRSELPTRLASTSTFSIEIEAHSSRASEYKYNRTFRAD
jgi:hypothetical protein